MYRVHDTCIVFKPETCIPSTFLSFLNFFSCNILHEKKSLTSKMEFVTEYQCKERVRLSFQLQGIYKYKEETFRSALNSHIWFLGA